MARQTALPHSLPPRVVTAEVAAAYVSVSKSTFLKMVDLGRMPRPRIIQGLRKGWDLRDVDMAIDALPYDGEAVADDTWD